jgi:hypothetical protein
MKFQQGDTVKNIKTGQVYVVISTEEQPYITLQATREGADEKADDAEAISMHEDFLELA